MPKAATQESKAARPANKTTGKAASVKKPAPAHKTGAAAPKAPVKSAKKTEQAVAKSVAETATAAQPENELKNEPKELEKPKKPKKPKMVRDSFTMPETEYKVLGEVKRACLRAGIEVKKSELLRLGVELIRHMELAQLKSVLSTLTPLKAVRPKKEK